MQRVERSVFGELNGKPIHLFRLSNANGMVAELLEFGGRIKALCIPDGQGGLDNMSVGYDTFEPYHARFNPWLGALLGRTASRVTGARFQIDGKTYNLSASGPAGSNMHGGFVGFDSRVWTGEADSDATGATLKLTYLSPDGEEGYPGNASVTVTYRLDDDNRFHMNWEAATDAPTIIDMSSHVYLNLNGFKNRDVMNEYLKVNASYYLEKDANRHPHRQLHPRGRLRVRPAHPKADGRTLSGRGVQSHHGSGRRRRHPARSGRSEHPGTGPLLHPAHHGPCPAGVQRL